uniref:Rapid ALkalinization Factor n=1 Tax=Kalanchoe fedtschenkoi TaxID=63787 RepID=A0A7N0V542_KALFE
MPDLLSRLALLLLLFLSIAISLLSVAHSSCASSPVNGTGSSHWMVDDEAEEQATTGSSLWEDHRRALAQNNNAKYISYSALKKNSVPCNKKGTSYYNCSTRQKANPYNRGCSQVTNCYRYTDL